MPELAETVSSTLAAYYEEVRDRVHALVGPLSTEQIWRKPYPYGNSIGHLLLHLTGNLNHYIGAGIARTGYVRNRALEFTDASKLTKAELLKNFDSAVEMVATTIRKQSEADLLSSYSDPTEPKSDSHFTVFFRMAAHAYHHTGQIIYLAKEVVK